MAPEYLSIWLPISGIFLPSSQSLYFLSLCLFFLKFV